MAEASKVLIPVQKVVDEEFIQLNLTVEEAIFLRDIIWHVGGDPIASRRKHGDAIKNAIRPFIPAKEWKDREDYGFEDGAFYFRSGVTD